MAGVNKVILVGHVGKDPELKTTQSGKSVLQFSMATSEKFKDSNGEQKEATEWHRCVMFDKLAGTMSQYIVKGKQIYVEGKLKTSSYEKDGQKRYSTDVIVFSVQLLGSSGAGTRPTPEPDSPSAGPESVDELGELPF